MTAEVSECSTVDVGSCNKSFVLLHGVKAVPRLKRRCHNWLGISWDTGTVLVQATSWGFAALGSPMTPMLSLLPLSVEYQCGHSLRSEVCAAAGTAGCTDRGDAFCCYSTSEKLKGLGGEETEEGETL